MARLFALPSCASVCATIANARSFYRGNANKGGVVKPYLIENAKSYQLARAGIRQTIGSQRVGIPLKLGPESPDTAGASFVVVGGLSGSFPWMSMCLAHARFCLGLSTRLPSGNCLRSGFRRTNPGQRLHERNAVVIRFVDHGSKAFSLKITHHAEQDELLRPPERT